MTASLSMTCEPTRIVTVKGGKQEYLRRLIWTAGDLRLRSDVTVTEAGKVHEAWALFAGSTLLTHGEMPAAAELTSALTAGFSLSAPEAEVFASEWHASALRDAHDYSRAGRAWARAKQLQTKSASRA